MSTAKHLSQSDLEKLVGKERVCELAGGSYGLRGGLNVKIEQPADQGSLPIVDFTASDETLDRYDEVVTAAGWQLANYKRNPVFQNSHKYGDVMFTLGKALITEVRGTSLFQRILFAVDINPIAKIAYDMYLQKFLNAVSVGFVPIRWETGSDQSAYRRKYLEQELLELSAVSIPANPNALANAMKAGAVDKSDVRELADFLKQFCSDQADPNTNSGSKGAGVNVDQLLQLMRSAKELVRR
jgi:HK97 family phage prohead protease